MQPAEWKTFIAQFAVLNRRQRQASTALLRGAGSQNAAVALIESVARQRLHCPACNSSHAHRHGHAHGLQRYRCVPCGRTFNALTGTPLARLRHKTLWLDYADCLLESASVRKAASQLGVHRNTAFRWRHRFLSLAKTDRPHCLHGIAEADELYVLESEKGARHLTRPARRRGGHAHKRGISSEQVCILVARDRTGQTRDFVAGKGALTKAQLHACLPPVIDKDILLMTDDHAAYRAFAKEAGISHQAVNVRAGIRVQGAAHVQNVNAYHSRLRAWLRSFHGVATRYLPNYLGWRWILDAGRIRSPETLLKATLGEFPHLTVT
ncbi:ISXO2-like transposase domain protein [Janthinobacterium sp. HH103]|uniref:IS1595 family transposase n=1 Tax=Janthinobacterium agaricidamnosum TaxID=55508 RepID=A0A3G2EAY9_9BURK|nr:MULTISPECIES: IS1595 family transposase [Janthinobacterium]AYM76255.1 IS1595 family transposase [Janthinobacterium agaricidamnosum]OEZ64268.1 ISXO2-like transposase domain protein [Janthinobacterium sp. HH100]OEZ89021.1 ISXO2-like transposase domain protein [Janthinobacterium sp. HH103]QOU73430.1 IS1595 family transposase ISJli1 [Janthinobacterium sp. HH102]